MSVSSHWEESRSREVYKTPWSGATQVAKKDNLGNPCARRRLHLRRCGRGCASCLLHRSAGLRGHL